MKIFELVVTETVKFRFSLPSPNKEKLLPYMKNEKVCHRFSLKPNIGTTAPTISI